MFALYFTGYDIVGDNVNMKVDPHQMSKTRQRKDHHLFNLIASMNRIGGENLDNSGPKVKASELQQMKILKLSKTHVPFL